MHAHDLLYDSTDLSPYPSAYPYNSPMSNPHVSAADDNMFTSPSTLSYSYSTVPTVAHDDDVPPHPTLGNELRLPVLLRLAKLRRFKIRDTHMGDPMWCAEEGQREWSRQLAPLEVLDLGSCAHESPAVNEQCTARILRRVPSTIKSFSLSTALPDAREQKMDESDETNASMPSLPHLRTLHLTPLVPVSALHTTLSQPTLAESPVHTLSVAFHPDDAGEGCEALAAFLGERGVGANPGLVKTNVHQRRRSASTSFVKTPSPLTNTSSRQPSSLLYPSLRTLRVDLASTESEVDTLDFSPCVSPSAYTPNTRNARALARARAAEERKALAVQKLRGVCRELGIEAVMAGVREEEEEVEVEKAVVNRSRSNST